MDVPIILILAAFNAAAFASGNRFQLEHSKDSFGMRSHGIVETLGAGRTKFYPLPQSTAEKYNRLRPEDARINPITLGDYERQEVIGPYQIEDGKIWFRQELLRRRRHERPRSVWLLRYCNAPIHAFLSARNGAVRGQRHSG